MDRSIVYPDSIPQDTDILATNKQPMIALGKLCAALLGTGGVVNGLPVTPTSPASLSVNVGAGEIYQLANVDNTPYGSLAADTTDQIVKQGILLQSAAPVALSCPAPTTAGFSINYLIEATYADADTNNVVLPYYNAANPVQPYAGPANNGTAQATTRAGTVSLQAKAGIAATTGTQTTPAVDSGYIALAVVTVANGQATIVSGNIAAVTTSVLSESLLAMINGVQTTGRFINVQRFTASGTYTPTAGTIKVIVEVQGAGGGGGGTASTTSSQFAVAGGGASGAYAKSLLTSGFSGQTVTIGAAGAGGAAGNNSGSTGGTSSFGAIMTANGGPGGIGGAATASGSIVVAQVTGVSATATGGTLVNSAGRSETLGIGISLGSAVSGSGNASIFGGGGRGNVGSTASGQASTSYGAGGGGAVASLSATAQAGGSGAPGVVVIWEYA